MAHAAARRRRAARDEAAHRFLAPALRLIHQELCGGFLRRAADLADHHDCFGLWIGEKQFQPLDEVHALHGIAADAELGGLAEPLKSMPFTGSPPMPSAVVWPSPSRVVWNTAS